MANVDNFRKVPVRVPYKSGFDKSYRHTLTGTCGTLVPVHYDELIANSDVYFRMPFNLRLPPLATDTFMNVDYKVEAFFVPTRLLMPGNGFEKFCTGETVLPYGSGSTTKLRTPVIDILNSQSTYQGAGTLSDYLGFYANFASSGGTFYVTAFPYLAYHLIYEEFYRNSLVSRSLLLDSLSSGANSYGPAYFKSIMPSEYTGFVMSLDDTFGINHAVGALHQRNFAADYFTVATPSTQNGPAMGVKLSLNTSNFKDILGVVLNNADPDADLDDLLTNDDLAHLANSIQNPNSPISFPGSNGDGQKGNYINTGRDNNGSVSSAALGGFTIASLRAANSVQQFLERNNIAGNRFVDFLRANYGANLSDGVAQRPIYLGSASFPVYTNGVFANGDPSVTGVTLNNPFKSVASNYGNAYAEGNSFVCKFHVDEPGYFMVIGSLVPEVSYSSGVVRKLLRYVDADTRAEMPNHLLQNVGPQPIVQAEFVSTIQPSPTFSASTVFGYVDRYADFMTSYNRVSGLVHDGQSLQSFVLQRTVANHVGISTAVLQIPTNFLDQVMAVTNANAGFQYWADFYFDYKVSMPLARYSIPSLQDPAYEHGDTIWMNRGGVRID